jgi:hypothetical protein
VQAPTSRSTGPEFGTRGSRHIEAVHRLAWQKVVEGRPQDTHPVERLTRASATNLQLSIISYRVAGRSRQDHPRTVEALSLLKTLFTRFWTGSLSGIVASPFMSQARLEAEIVSLLEGSLSTQQTDAAAG